ncbi:MAG: FG-GAP-like repeat-containing protein [Candidatus Sumerlaeia bacterium]
MKVKAVSTICRRIVLPMILMLLALPVRAGGPLSVPILVENDPSTTADNQMKPVTLHWNEVMDPPHFYYQAYQPGDIIILPGVTIPKESQRPTRIETLRAMNAALKTWNDAKFSNFRFYDQVISAIYAPSIPFTNPPVYPYGIALDGYNMISFIDESPFTSDDVVCVPIMSYFNQDYDPSKLIGQYGVPIEYLSGMVYGTDVVVLVYDFNGDGIVDLWLPYTKYKAGEFIEVDLAVHPGNTQWLRSWPERYSDVPDGDKIDVIGSLDIQMIMTHLFGYATGLGESTLAGAVMNRYFESQASQYPTDPYQKRILAFDDEMNAGIVHGSFPSTTASIGGQILEGALLDASTDNDEGLDLFVAQATVFLCVRPETLAQSNWLNCGRTITPNYPDPDNVSSTPMIPDANQGIYRMIAEVLSGSELMMPVGPGDDIFSWITAEGDQFGGDTVQPGGNPVYEDGTFFTDAGTLIEDGIYSSDYKFPGLVPTDDIGTTISYAVMLGIVQSVAASGDTGGGDTQTEVLINPVQVLFTEAYDPEFYGGTTTQLSLGTGIAVDENVLQDDFFENEYVTAEVDVSGRIAAAINDGPSFLSGFNIGPRSYVILNTSKGTYTNREGAIGTTNEAMVIDDAANTANGSWLRASDFSLRQQVSISQNGGVSGIPSGLQVSYTLSNNGLTTSTYTLRQVLDTVQFGLENPLYVVDSAPYYHEHTWTGSDIPTELRYQTSLKNPSFSSYITLRGTNLYTPDEVTIAKLTNLTKTFAKDGALIGGPGSSGDSGVALVWKNIVLAPGETRRCSYIIGFFQPGSVEDGYAEATYDSEGNLIDGNDDPQHIQTIELSWGENLDNINILTNTGTVSETGTTGGDDTTIPPSDSDIYPGNDLSFTLAGAAFPDTDYISMSGVVGDIDNDGDLDVVTAGYGGGVDPVAGRLNRIYVNEQKIETDGSVTFYFRDVTFGSDGRVGTIDDRLKSMTQVDGKDYPVAAPSDTSVGVVLADFNNDGYLDLFFTNQLAQNRFYLNEGASNPGFFIDKSDQWLPGLLNVGWDDTTRLDYPFRATAGDIDSDGDMDLIISELMPQVDDPSAPTCAWIDVSPGGNSENFRMGDQRPHSVNDLWSEPLLFTERVLINQVNRPPYSASPKGEWFVDETLGADDRFGTLSSLEVVYSNDDPVYGTESFRSWEPSELDRMPPVFPKLVQFTTPRPTRIASPMANCASEPHLGPLEYHGGLDLLSVRPYHNGLGSYWINGTYPLTATPPADAPTPAPESYVTGVIPYTPIGSDEADMHGQDPGLFRNLDLFTMAADNVNEYTQIGEQYSLLSADGIPDGYFGCMNYGDDYNYNPYVFGRLGGLNFVSYTDEETQETVTTGTLALQLGLFAFAIDPNTLEFKSDANALFIGLPDSNTGDLNEDSYTNGEMDALPAGRVAWAGLIADFTNHGSGDIFIGSDNDEENSRKPYFVYQSTFTDYNDEGVSRQQLYGGTGYLYRHTDLYPYYSPIYWDSNLQLPLPPATDPITLLGEPYSAAAADFDQDGDNDIYVATTTREGISAENGMFHLIGSPWQDRFYVNDSWGVFMEGSSAVASSGNVISMQVLHADYDNDGDEDIICFNAQAPNQVLKNQIYTAPPDTNDEVDGKMFHDASISMVPPLINMAMAPPLTLPGIPAGVNVRTAMADFNNDGLPDMITARGGHFTALGDFDQILINTGEPKYGGIRTFKPYNSPYPAPAINVSNAQTATNIYNLSGMIDVQAFNTDVAVGDVDNDGDNDVALLREERSGIEEPMALYINEDIDDLMYNTMPDSDSVGDGYFKESAPGLWPELETPGTAPGGLNLKRQAQRALFADFNNDGRLDLIIANGLQGNGAPNVLLLNQPIGTQPYNFVDCTETNLPLESGGVTGINDNTTDLAVGDFDSDGNVDIIFANRWIDAAQVGFRYLHNDGNAIFADDDPTFAAPDSQRRIPSYNGRVPRGIVAADFDGMGEPTEDTNHNGYLDLGEDTNGNGVLDWTDLPTETEDLNGNGKLDAGEDGLIDSNGRLDSYDRNGDGIITAYRDGVWDGSLDIFISFGGTYIGDTSGDMPVLLINDPTNQHPGYFTDETSKRFGDDLQADPNGGCDAGDIDLDGDIDIVQSRLVGGNTRQVKVYRNDITKTTIGGYYRKGYFKDISYEVPFTVGNCIITEAHEIIENQPELGMAPDKGDNMNSVTGYAADVKLSDIDGDKDLDMVITCCGNSNNLVTVGALNVVMVNRVIGDNWNARKNVTNALRTSSPRVTGITPRGAERGEVRDIAVYGYNFQAGMSVDFGSGVTVVNVEQVDAFTANVQVRVADTATIGPRKVTVSNPSGGATSTKAGMFNVYDRTLLDQYYKNAVPSGDWSLFK